MFQIYPNIQYDEATRRINRWTRIGAVVGVVLLIAGLAYAADQVEVPGDGPLVVNDTRGTVSCVYRTQTEGRRFWGTVDPNREMNVPTHSACTVYDNDGDYLGCLRIPEGTSDDARLRASTADTRVKAQACVYPR